MSVPTRRRLLCHHVPIATSSMILVLLLHGTIRSPAGLSRWSVALAHVSFMLLAAALAIGPARVLRAQPNPVSSDLRRDLGIWSGIAGLAHVIGGLQIHAGHPLLYFLRGTPEAIRLAVRTDLFGLTNYVGLVATALVVLLLALSNDRSLRRLGVKRWKAWQRSSYILCALTVGHGAVYQVVRSASRRSCCSSCLSWPELPRYSCWRAEKSSGSAGSRCPEIEPPTGKDLCL